MSRTVRGAYALAVALILGLAAAASAQVDRATLTGTVKDPSDAVIPRATVTLTNLATGVASRATANEDGSYLVINLAPGEYLVQAEAQGFQRFEQTVRLEVGQRARLDLSLPVGSVDETVKVEGVTPLLNTESAVLGAVVGQNEVAKLPLAIRNWDDLLALVAGVQGDRYTEEAGGTASGRTGGVYVHGNRSLQNNFLLDGVDNNSISTNVQELTTQVSRPSVDSINEFKIVTSPFSAEYGRSPGAAISVTTKSGTNTLRGTAYHFYRNDRFDSNTFFANRAGGAKPANDQNQFGGNLGGPIWRNRVFFFGDYEGTRITKGVTRITRIPNENERRGVFDRTIRDPLTGLPFPNNTVPQDRIDPVAAAVFRLLPAPNQPGLNNFFRQPNVDDDADRIMGRVDLALSGNDTIFVRYIYSDRNRFIPGYLGGTLDGTGTSAWGRQTISSNGLVGGWTKVLGSSLVNELRVSWSAADSDAVQDPFGANGPDLVGLRGVPDDPRINGGIAGITIDNYFTGSGGGRIGSPDFLPKFQRTNQVEYLNTLTWLRGDHQVKFGANIMTPMENDYLDIPATRGALRFRGRFTGDPVADFLLGYVADAQLSNVHVVDQRHWATSFFVQDDWKLSPRATLNLGLRYDFITPALEADDRQANFDPATRTLVFARDGSLEDRGLVRSDRNNFAPRIGLVYQVTERTIARGGYGIFYNLFDRIGSEDQLALNPPGLINNSLTTTSTTTPLFLLRNGFPANFLDPAALDLSRIRVRAVDRDAPKSMIHQFSVGMQRQLGPALSLSADFVGSEGRNLANLRNLNQPLNGSGPLPFPGFGFIEWREQRARSNYRGLDVMLDKRFSDGYSFGVAYTASRSRDNSGEHLATPASFPQDTNNLDAWYGPSDYDIPHRFVTHFVAELPFGEGKRWATSGPARIVFGGWLVSGIFTARSGRPFTVTQGSNNVGINMTGLPDRIGDPEGEKTVDRWFNVGAFRAVPSGTFGNSTRNVARGPGFQVFDFSLQRRIDVTDRWNATLRWDVFNAFNRANFGLPDANISNSSAGRITSLAGDPRIMQFSVRVAF